MNQYLIREKLIRLYEVQTTDWNRRRIAWDTAINYAGPSFKKQRQDIVLEMTGQKMPIAKCGVNNLMHIFAEYLNSTGRLQTI